VGKKLTNFEVFQIIKEEAARFSISAKLEAVTRDVESYVRESVNHTRHLDAQFNDLKILMDKLKQTDLTESERTQIINLRPVSLVEIHLIVDKCTTRFSEADVDAILELVKQYVPEFKDFS